MICVERRPLLILVLAATVLTPLTLRGDAHAKTLSEHDRRMTWWREARFGMFIHWGLYSIPAGVWKGQEVTGLSCWNPSTLRIPTAEWSALSRQFNPVKYQPRDWAKLAKSAGMKYAVITVKHHDGFCLFDSKLTDFTAMHCPAHRDLIREWVEAFRGEGLRVGFYYSLIDWHHPQYPVAGDPFHPERDRPEVVAQPRDLNKYLEYMHSQVRELMTNYGKIDILWFDFSYEPKMHGEAWRATELMNMVRTLQPDIIVNNRLESAGEVRTGSTALGDFSTPEQKIPGDSAVDWETCMTMNDDWGYKSFDHNWKSTETLLRNLVDICSKGGNYLLNVGPTAEGVIPQASVGRLEQIGRWMQVNGESIYGTSASPFKQQFPWGRCTCKTLHDGKTRLYLHVFDWPKDGRLPVQGLNSEPSAAYLLADADRHAVRVLRSEAGMTVALPDMTAHVRPAVVVLEFCNRPKIK